MTGRVAWGCAALKMHALEKWVFTQVSLMIYFTLSLDHYF